MALASANLTRQSGHSHRRSSQSTKVPEGPCSHASYKRAVRELLIPSQGDNGHIGQCQGLSGLPLGEH
eukprot:2747176-Amphidinium_carterae.1